MQCRLCSSETKVFLDLSHIPFSVTSDCRVVDIGVKLFICESCSLIQKNSTQLLQQNYFDDFCSHSISDGIEQVKFVDGVPIPRSELILQNIKSEIKKEGSLLDIGTGNGSFLKAFKKFFPNWQLFGQDIQSNSKEEILKIVPEENLYIKDIKHIDKKFDMISIIGVLGHIPDVKEFLSNLKNITHKDSAILIQTADIQKNFFDVVIVDYITYFSKSILDKIISEHFNNISFFDIVHKEITLLSDTKNTTKSLDYEKEMKDILNQAQIFEKFVNFLATTKDSFVVFGTAPVSTYIGAVLGDKLISFSDEDTLRIGKTHLNKDIVHPKEIDEQHKIILPFLQSDIVQSIKERYKKYSFISYMDI